MRRTLFEEADKRSADARNADECNDFAVIGARLRDIRVAAGITAQTLSREIGIHNSRLSRIENGQSIVRLDELIAIFEVIRPSIRVRSEMLSLFNRLSSNRSRNPLSALTDVVKPVGQIMTGRQTNRWFSQAELPLMLQTATYARGVANSRDNGTSDLLGSWVHSQDDIYNKDIAHEILLSERALQAHHLDAADTRIQLNRVLQIASMSNVWMGIVSESSVGMVCKGIDFTIMNTEFVIVNDGCTDVCESIEAVIAEYLEIFRRLKADALTGNSMREYISTIKQK